ncbi:MAG: DUF2834 domain-containing protein [Mycobacterium sp.]
MTTTRKTLCGIYAAIAAVALVATWTQNAAYFGAGPGFLKDFLEDLKVNAASRSITLDILLFLLAAVIFMVIEARKVGVPYVWAYVVGGLLIAMRDLPAVPDRPGAQTGRHRPARPRAPRRDRSDGVRGTDRHPGHLHRQRLSQ